MPFTGKGSLPVPSSPKALLLEDRNPAISETSTSHSDRFPACQQASLVVAYPHNIAPKASIMDPAMKDVTSRKKVDSDEECSALSTTGTVEEDYGRTSVIDIWRRRERENLERQKIQKAASSPRVKKAAKKSSEEHIHWCPKKNIKDTKDKTAGDLKSKKNSTATENAVAEKEGSSVKESYSDVSAGTGLQTVVASFDDGVVAFDKNHSPFSSPSRYLRKASSPYPDLLARRSHSGISRLEIPPSGSSKEVAEHQEKAAARLQIAPSPTTLKKTHTEANAENARNVWSQRDKTPASPSFLTRRSPASVTANFFDLQSQGVHANSTGSRDSHDNQEVGGAAKLPSPIFEEKCTANDGIKSPNRRSLSVLDRWKQGMVHTDDFSSSQENSPLSRTRSNKMRQLVANEESTYQITSVSQTRESPRQENAGSAVDTTEAPVAGSPARSFFTETQEEQNLPFDETHNSPVSQESPGATTWINFPSTPMGNVHDKMSANLQLPSRESDAFTLSPLSRKNLDKRFETVSNSSLNHDVTDKEEMHHSVEEEAAEASGSKATKADIITADPGKVKSVPGSLAVQKSFTGNSEQRNSGSVLDRWSHHIQTTNSTPYIGKTSRNVNGKMLPGSSSAVPTRDTQAVDNEMIEDFSRKLCVEQNQRNVRMFNDNSGINNKQELLFSHQVACSPVSNQTKLDKGEDLLRLDFTQESVLSSRSDLSVAHEDFPERNGLNCVGKVQPFRQKIEADSRSLPPNPAVYASDSTNEIKKQQSFCAPVTIWKKEASNRSPKRKFHEAEDLKPASWQVQRELGKTKNEPEVQTLRETSNQNGFPTTENRLSPCDSEMPRSENSRQAYFIKKGKVRAHTRRRQGMSPSSDRWPAPNQNRSGDHHFGDNSKSTDDQIGYSGDSSSGNFLQGRAQPLALSTKTEPNSNRASDQTDMASKTENKAEILDLHQNDNVSFFSHAGSAFSSVTTPSNRTFILGKDAAGETSVAALHTLEETKPEIPVSESLVSVKHSVASPVTSSSQSFPMDEMDVSFQEDTVPRLARRYHTSSRFLDVTVNQSFSYAVDNSTIDSAQNSSQENSACTSVSSNYSYDSGGSESGFLPAVEETYKRRRRKRKTRPSKSASVFQEELSRAFQSAYHSIGLKTFSEGVSETVKALDLPQLTSELHEGMHVASDSLLRLVVESTSTSTNAPESSSPVVNLPTEQGARDEIAPNYEGVAIEVEYISDSDEGSEAYDLLSSQNNGGEDPLSVMPVLSEIFSLGNATSSSLVFLGQVNMGSSTQANMGSSTQA